MSTPETSNEPQADAPPSNLSRQIAIARKLYGPDVGETYKNDGHIPAERDVAARAEKLFPASFPRLPKHKPR